MIGKPAIVRTEERIAAVVHLKIPRDQIQNEMAPAIQEVLAAIADQGQSPQGPLFAHHLTQSSSHFDIEVGFPVSVPIEPQGRVRSSTLPAARAAFTVYTGDYDGLFDAWQAFRQESRNLLEREHLVRGATLWEIYATGPESESNPANWRTELYQSLQPAG